MVPYYFPSTVFSPAENLSLVQESHSLWGISTLLHKPKLCPISELGKPIIRTLSSRGLCLLIFWALHFGDLIGKQFLTSADLFYIIKSGISGQMCECLKDSQGSPKLCCISGVCTDSRDSLRHEKLISCKLSCWWIQLFTRSKLSLWVLCFSS